MPPLAASTPNRIIGTHRLILRWFILNALELAAANAHDWHPDFIMKLWITFHLQRAA